MLLHRRSSSFGTVTHDDVQPDMAAIAFVPAVDLLCPTAKGVLDVEGVLMYPFSDTRTNLGKKVEGHGVFGPIVAAE